MITIYNFFFLNNGQPFIRFFLEHSQQLINYILSICVNIAQSTGRFSKFVRNDRETEMRETVPRTLFGLFDRKTV